MPDESRKYAIRNSYGYTEHLTAQEIANLREMGETVNVIDPAWNMHRCQIDLKAGNIWVDGQPGYYEDGGTTGEPGRRERYSGDEGPFGEGHHHDTSFDGGKTWRRWH